MTALATLSYAPAPGTRAAPVAVAAFRSDAALLRVMGKTGDSLLDLRPFAALFPRHVGLAWAFGEWVDWLEASLLEEHISLDELKYRLDKPSMRSLKVTDVVSAQGDPNQLLNAHFSHQVHWPPSPPSHIANYLVEQQVFSLVGQLADGIGLQIVESEMPSSWDVTVRGRLTGRVATKISGLKEAPPMTIPRITRNLPTQGADKFLVITDMPNLALHLEGAGIQTIAFDDQQYLAKLSGWLATLA